MQVVFSTSRSRRTTSGGSITSLPPPAPADRGRPPGAELLTAHLHVSEIRVLVPKDCQDGFGSAFCALPEAYLDPEVQAGMSWLAMQPPEDLALGSARLRRRPRLR